jgi:hypothetical protein
VCYGAQRTVALTLSHVSYAASIDGQGSTDLELGSAALLDADDDGARQALGYTLLVAPARARVRLTHQQVIHGRQLLLVLPRHATLGHYAEAAVVLMGLCDLRSLQSARAFSLQFTRSFSYTLSPVESHTV